MKTQILSLKTKLTFASEEDKQSLLRTLELSRDAFNYCSTLQFGCPNNIISLHAKFYKSAREKFPELKSPFVVSVENACLSAYRSIKSNKHVIDKPICKKRLSLNLNKCTIRIKDNTFFITSIGKRLKCLPKMYPKFVEHLSKYKFGDPTIFVRGNDIYISIPFKIEVKETNSKSVLGIDLGIRRLASTSEGNLYIDKQFNKEKRKLRYQKRILQSKKKTSNSAKRKLKKLKRKERNKNINFVHHLVNAILRTKCDAIAIEDLDNKKLKRKQHKFQNKNRISQVSFSLLKMFLTYKAALLGKEVVCVNPMFTSQIDSLTGLKDGVRQGCRYYCKNGLVLDADVNAAINIAHRSKLPTSYRNVLDGQATVNTPIVGGNTCKSITF